MANPGDLLPMGKIEEAKVAWEQMAEYAIKDMVYVGSELYEKAGADGIMIHSKKKKPDEILEFCGKYNKINNKVPLVVVPTTYCAITEDELEKAGVRIVIYGNHLLRSAYPSMVKTAEMILENKRAEEASKNCAPVKDIIKLIPGNE